MYLISIHSHFHYNEHIEKFMFRDFFPFFVQPKCAEGKWKSCTNKLSDVIFVFIADCFLENMEK